MANKYVDEPWNLKLARSQTSSFKKFSYGLTKPILDMRAKLSSLRGLKPKKSVLISEHGFYLEKRRRWALEGIDLNNASIFVQGTGSGWDVCSWALYKPRRIVAIDLFKFDNWPEVVEYCNNLGVDVEFLVGSLDTDNGIDEKFDLIASDAVFEHCVNFQSVVEQSFALLKPNGRLYANYGPLWNCAGGDHLSGIDDLVNSYNHISLSVDQYSDYVNEVSVGVESFQGGARYIELDLFSKLSTNEYLQCYENCGFQIEDLHIEVSKRACEFEKKYPALIKKLEQKIGTDEAYFDLFAKAHHVRLKKY